MKDDRSLRELVKPIFLAQDATPLHALWRALENGQPVVVLRGEQWWVLTPEDAVGYPRTRPLVDLPLRPALTVDVDLDPAEVATALEARGERLGIVLEQGQPIGAVHFADLLAEVSRRAAGAARLGDFLRATLDAVGAVAWHWRPPQPLAFPQRLDDLWDAFQDPAQAFTLHGPVEALVGDLPAEFSASIAPWIARVHPEDAAAWGTLIEPVLQDRRLRLRYRLRHAQGHWVWLQSELFVEVDDQGRLVGLRGIATDITPQVEAEEEARRRQQIRHLLAERRPGEALERVFAQLGEWLPVDHAALFIVEEGGDVRMESAWVRPGWEEAVAQVADEMSRRVAAARAEGAPLPWGAFAEAIRARRSVYLPDLRGRAASGGEVVARHGLHSAFILPLIQREDLHILVSLTAGAVDAFDEKQRRFIELLQPTLAAAAEAWYYEFELKALNAELETRVRQRTFELQILYELSQQIGYALDYDELFRQIVRQLHRVVNYDVAATLLVTDEQRELYIYPARPLRPEVEAAVKSRLLHGFQSLTGEDAPDLTALRAHAGQPFAERGKPVARLQSFFMVPLMSEARQVLGLLLVAAETEGAFHEDQVRLLYTVAQQASVSIRRLQALLAEEQKRLENLVAHLPAGVLLLSPEHRLLLANPLGRAYLARLGDHPPGSLMFSLGDRPIEEVLQQASGEAPLEFRPADAPETVFELRARPIPAGPTKGGHVLVLQDVTRERQLLASERQRRAELDALYQLSRQLAASEDLAEIVQMVTRRAVATIGVTFSAILVREEDELVWRGAYSLRELPGKRPWQVGERPPTATRKVLQRALRRRQPWVLATSPDADKAARTLLETFAVQTLCLAPLHVADEPVGLLLLGEARRPEREPFDEDKLRLVSAIADMAAGAIHRALLHHQLEQAYYEAQRRAQQMEHLVAVGTTLDRTLTVDAAVAAIGRAAQSLSGTPRVAVYVRDDGSFRCRWAEGVSPTYAQTVTEHLDEIPGGRFREEAQPILIPAVSELEDYPLLQELAEKEGYRSLALWPLAFEGRTIAVVACYYDRPHTWPAVERESLIAFSAQAAVALRNAQLYEELEEAYVQTVLALSKAMDARDTYTGDHSQRLAAWAEAVARQLGCDEAEIEAIRWGALLHDIGKIGVPDAILRKPGKLTDEEWEVIKRHPEIGAQIVAPVKRLAHVAPIIRAHHEKYDGSGYPDGLKGEEIPLGARILAVVDAYSAIIDERPYKPARSHEEAVAELRRCAGTHFDPQVVEAFLRVLGETKQAEGNPHR